MALPAQPHHLRIAGLALTGLSAVAAEGAWLHMRALGAAYGAICGATAVPHCTLCPLSVALLAAGLASFAAGILRPTAAAAASRPGVRK